MLAREKIEYRNRNRTASPEFGPLHMAIRSDRCLSDGDALDRRELCAFESAHVARDCIDSRVGADDRSSHDSGSVECGGSGHGDSGNRNWRLNGILSSACLRRDRVGRASDRDEHGTRLRRIPGSGPRRERSGSWSAISDAWDAGLSGIGRTSDIDRFAGAQLPGMARVRERVERTDSRRTTGVDGPDVRLCAEDCATGDNGDSGRQSVVWDYESSGADTESVRSWFSGCDVIGLRGHFLEHGSSARERFEFLGAYDGQDFAIA
jgi:hypothetical protein